MSEKNRIDYSKYEVDELAETISDAIFFPLYIGKVLGTVLLVFLVFLSLFAHFFIQNTFLAFIFWIITLVLSLPSVVLFSVIRLFSTIQSDIEKVYEITLKTAKDAYNDGGLLKAQRQGDVPLQTTFADVFKGVALFVVRPLLCRVLEKRIKFFSYPFVFVINSIFKKFITKQSKAISEEDALNVRTQSDEVESKNYKFSGTTFKVFKFPFRLALVIYGFINFCLVYFFYWVFS
ncbi:MAG: hypothetical protein Wins2KO_22180 [Winogradskyella sp.]